MSCECLYPFHQQEQRKCLCVQWDLWGWAETVYLLFSYRYTFGYDSDARWVTAGDYWKKKNPRLLCTTQFSCCYALNYALKQQGIVICMFTNPIHTNTPNWFYLPILFVFVYHAHFQGLYLSGVIANCCKLQCRASCTIMQNATLRVNCSHATLNVCIVFTQALKADSVPQSLSFFST